MGGAEQPTTAMVGSIVGFCFGGVCFSRLCGRGRMWRIFLFSYFSSDLNDVIATLHAIAAIA
jgi:hypothetical protein